MELKDTIQMMTSDDYRERLKAEYYQVKIRTKKLKTILDADKAGTLPFKLNCPRSVLLAQYWTMHCYMCHLSHRALIEKIDLEE